MDMTGKVLHEKVERTIRKITTWLQFGLASMKTLNKLCVGVGQSKENM
jgi:hypothetical protein